MKLVFLDEKCGVVWSIFIETEDLKIEAVYFLLAINIKVRTVLLIHLIKVSLKIRKIVRYGRELQEIRNKLTNFNAFQAIKSNLVSCSTDIGWWMNARVEIFLLWSSSWKSSDINDTQGRFYIMILPKVLKAFDQTKETRIFSFQLAS